MMLAFCSPAGRAAVGAVSGDPETVAARLSLVVATNRIDPIIVAMATETAHKRRKGFIANPPCRGIEQIDR
jgi:hypothetical protein